MRPSGCISSHHAPRRQKRHVKRKVLKPSPFIFTQRPEADDHDDVDDSFLSRATTTLGTLAKSLMPEDYKQTLLAGALISTLIGAVLSVVTLMRKPTKIAMSILVTQIMTYIALTLTYVDMEPEDKNEITENLTSALPSILAPSKSISERLDKWHKPGMVRSQSSHSYKLTKRQEEFLLTFEDMDSLPPKFLIFREVNKNWKDLPFPASTAPQLTTSSVCSREFDFNYPDWFLLHIWDVDQDHLDICRSILKDPESFLKIIFHDVNKTADVKKKNKYSLIHHDDHGIDKKVVDQFAKIFDNTRGRTSCESDSDADPELMALPNLESDPEERERVARTRAEQLKNAQRQQPPPGFIPLVCTDAPQQTSGEESAAEILREVRLNLNSHITRDIRRIAKANDMLPEALIDEEDEKTIGACVKLMFAKLVCLFIFLFDCCILKEKFKMSNLVKSMRLAETIETEGTDLMDVFRLCLGKKTSRTEQLDEIKKYTEGFNKFMETPIHELAREPMQVSKCKTLTTEYSAWYKNLDQKKRTENANLNTLYAQVNSKIHKYYATDIKSMSRQEPFVIMLRGTPGIGKTQLAKTLAKRVCEEVLMCDPKENLAEITPDDKYWPPFGGQAVALFDDCAGVRDFKEDLLMKNIKGICSPTMFNAAAADVEHKTNPINFKVIVATTNTAWTDIAARIASLYDTASVDAYMRRMILLDVEWNTTFAPTMNPNTPWSNKYDKSGNFAHLKFYKNSCAGGKITQGGTATLDDVMREIKKREAHYKNDFNTWLLRMSQQTESDTSSVEHFSIALHGRLKSGKSWLATQLLKSISTSLSMPTQVIDSFEKLVKYRPSKRSIVLLDDIVRPNITSDEENKLMDFYNSQLPSGSILLSTTNVSPVVSWIPRFDLLQVKPNMKLPFRNEGLIRRLGFGGMYGTAVVDSTAEFRVSNRRYYRNARINTTFYTDFFKDLAARVLTAWLVIIACIIDVCLIYMPILTFVALYIHFIAQLGIEEEELDVNTIKEYIYEQYRQFNEMRGSVTVKYVERIETTTEANLECYCQNSENFMQGSLSDLDERLFTTRSAYSYALKDWKVYAHPRLLVEMQNNIERYRCPNLDLSEEGLISMISRYVAAFSCTNIKPVIRGYFTGYGEYHYENGTLQIVSRPTNWDTQGCQQCFLYQSDEAKWMCAVFTRVFPLEQVVDLEAHDILSLGLSYVEAQALGEFRLSSNFLRHPAVIAIVKQRTTDKLKNLTLLGLKNLKDTYKSFIQHPLGITCMVILGVISSVVGVMCLYSLIKGRLQSDDESDYEPRQRKSGRKGSKKSRRYDSDDDRRERKNGRKGSSKSRRFDSDDDRRKQNRDDSTDDDETFIQETRKRGRRGNQKTRKYDSDDDRKPQHTNARTENVLTKADMNDHESYKAYYSAAQVQSQKNLCQIYQDRSKEDILAHEPEARVCYGLFIFSNVLITVGHIREVKNNLYVGADEFEGYHKMVSILSFPKRDMSVWYVPTVKKQYPDITNRFLSQNLFDTSSEWNSAFVRFAPGKTMEHHYSRFAYNEGPDCFVHGELVKWGGCIYATFGPKVSDGGDCGLPYFFAEKLSILQNKIIGLHCMGNIENTLTSTVVACVFTEDIEAIRKAYDKKMSVKQTRCCDFSTTKLVEKPDDYPKVEGHTNIWHSEHTSSWQTLAEEMKFALSHKNKFTGLIIKQAGKLMGSVEHSHLQLLPDVEDETIENVMPWRSVDLHDLEPKRFDVGTMGSRMVTWWDERNLDKHVKKFRLYDINFKIRMHRVFVKLQRKYMLHTEIILYVDMTKQLHEKQILDHIPENDLTDTPVPFPSAIGDPVYVAPTISSLLEGAKNMLERGKQGDVPFESVPENETVHVIGSFHQSKSHTPRNHFVQSPFSKVVEHLVPIEKKPCIYDLTLTPPEAQEQMVTNNYGIKCPRATLSLGWAHKAYGNPQLLKEISKQFIKKIWHHYSNLRLLTDDEVLSGISNPKDKMAGHLEGMELDTSIGFTMSELFYVRKKNDVIGLDETGRYFWLNNAASTYLHHLYDQAKLLSANGRKYVSIFTEMLKMEKLKIAKIYKGRTFVAQDILGVLMERRNLGYFCARAKVADPNCGVGIDPVATFNRVYTSLSKHPNLWAGDYKNFDRNTPACVQHELTKLLCTVNPSIGREIKSTMLTNIQRMQVSGTTLFEVNGGMPSGCFCTAAMNSLNNEYLMYASFYILAEQYSLDSSWEAYTANVERIYYGDDVMVSVSDEYAPSFNRKNVSQILLEHFGMILDSSAKDGTAADFDTFETASWISRFFRQLGQYPIHVGALKKISIGANFHYVTSLEPAHLGRLMEIAQWEAAFWDEEYFNTIQNAIRLVIQIQPRMMKYVQLRLQSDIRDEAFQMAMPCALLPNQATYATVVAVSVNNNQTRKLYETLICYFERYIFPKEYKRTVIKPVILSNHASYKGTHYETYYAKQTKKTSPDMSKLAGAYSQKMNNLFQRGLITKPTYTYESKGPGEHLTWFCTLSATRTADNVSGIVTDNGFTKQEAKEGASYLYIREYFPDEAPPLTERVNPQCMKPEMLEPSPDINMLRIEVETVISDLEPLIKPIGDVDEIVDNMDFFRECLEQAAEVFKEYEEARKHLRNGHFDSCCWSKIGCREGPDTCKCVSLSFRIKDLIKIRADAIRLCSTKRLRPVLSILRKQERLARMQEIIRTSLPEADINVSGQTVGKTPGAPMTSTDVSVVQDAGLYTNTAAPAIARVMNPLALALDNPAGSGAPFNKHTSVYNIYQRWENKNTVISPALASGTEILRLSLDPDDLPSSIKSYVDFHDSFIPALDIVVAIAGAAGTIGWLACGWVKDASKSRQYTLNQLQQIALEETNMNGTQVLKISLSDARRNGLFRLTKGDPEPYPGVILMVDHAVTNVQRNDAVNYPVRVQVRLAPSCILMEPFSTPSSGPSTLSLNLGSYFYDSNTDLLIGGSSVPSEPNAIVSYPDCGYNTKSFDPLFQQQNLIACSYAYSTGLTDTYFQIASKYETIPATYLAEINELNISDAATIQTTCFPSDIYFAFGDIIPLPDTIYRATQPTIQASVYKINKVVDLGLAPQYIANTIYAYPNGCIIRLTCNTSLVDVTTPGGSQKAIVYNNSTKVIYDVSDTEVLQYSEGIDFKTVFIGQDDTHNNTATGDLLTIRTPSLNRGSAMAWVYHHTETVSDLTTTFVLTGNSYPGSNLPTGLKQVAFLRNGTSTQVSQDSPFVPLSKPFVTGAYQALQDILDQNNWAALKGDLVIAGVNRGEIGFQNGTFLCRTDNFKQILPGIGSDIKLNNIVQLENVQGLVVYNTTGYSSWVTSTNLFKLRRINLMNFRPEAAIAGGMISGLGQGLTSFTDQMFRQQMLDKVLANNAGIAGANNAALEQRQRKAFEYSMQLSGANAASAQHGVQFVGPLDTLNRSVYDNESRNGGGVTRGNATIPPPLHLDSKLNPNAAEFVPKISGSTLNPEAPAFIPKSNLNPNAPEFVPKSTLNPNAPEFTPKTNTPKQNPLGDLSDGVFEPEDVIVNPPQGVQHASIGINNNATGH